MIFKRQALLNFYSTQVFKRCFFKSLRALLLINNVVIVLHQAPQLLEVQMLIFTKCIIQFQLHPSPTGNCGAFAGVGHQYIAGGGCHGWSWNCLIHRIFAKTPATWTSIPVTNFQISGGWFFRWNLLNRGYWPRLGRFQLTAPNSDQSDCKKWNEAEV